MWRRRTLDTKQLRDHLDHTIDAIRRHRARIRPTSPGYSDTPTFGGFGPKSPCNDAMIDLADAEAAHLGNVASTCIRRGTIPPVSLRPLWFTNRGKCIGLRIIGHDDDEFDIDGNHTGPDYLEPLYPIVQHLKAYAGEVVETEGVGWLLHEWGTTRDVYHEIYPVEAPEWLTLDEAARRVGRSKFTVRDWRYQGVVRCLKDGGPILYHADDLALISGIKSENMHRGTLTKRVV